MSKENSKQKVHVEIFAAGDGVNYPKKGHKVTIHYTAYLAHNGQKFDSVSCFSLNKKIPSIVSILCLSQITWISSMFQIENNLNMMLVPSCTDI